MVIGGRLYGGSNTGAGEIGSAPTATATTSTGWQQPVFRRTRHHGQGGLRTRCGRRSEALALWREFGEQVGDLVMLVLYAYDPEAIVFGGSISRAFEFFRGSMFERLRAFPMPKPWSGCTSAVRR